MTTLVIENKKARADFEARIQVEQDLVTPQPGDWQANRATIFRRLAEVQKRIDARDEMRAYIERLKAEQDAAVNQHAEKTAPLQDKLAGDLSPAERIEIRRQVDAVNADFEPIFETFRKQISAATSELETLTFATASYSPLQSKLTHPDCCDPRLDEEREALRVAEIIFENWAVDSARGVEAIENDIENQRERRRRHGQSGEAQVARETLRRIRIRKATLALAEKLRADVRTRLQEICHEMIAE